MLLPLTLPLVIVLLLLELHSDEVYIDEFLFPLAWVRTEVFVLYHSLGKVRDDPVPDDVDKVMIHYLCIDM